jgi:hypothetical protein
MLQEGLYSLLIASDLITAIVGTPQSRGDGTLPVFPGGEQPATTGVFGGHLPKAIVLPALVISEIHGGASVFSMDGPANMLFSRVQFSCFGNTYAQAKTLARAVRLLLEQFTGALPDGTVVDSMYRVAELDAFEDSVSIFHTPVDIEVIYHELFVA